jgi:hypothetical protein
MFPPIILLSMIKLYIISLFFVFILIGALKMAYSYYKDYYEIMLYDDRIRMIDIRGTTIRDIYFSQISNVGFLHGDTFVYNRFDSEGVRSEEIVLLLEDGSRLEISDELSNLHELCSVIQQKIGR